jgi:DNA-binding response OmpR family regulator
MNQKPKVLIVDDEPNNVDFLEQALEDSGYQLITATNGQEALNKIQSEQPDLVLLDLAMPIMDGFAVLAEVKADQVLRDIPVIIISAEHDSKSVVKGIKQGAEDYLTKPVNADILVKKVKEYLG